MVLVKDDVGVYSCFLLSDGDMFLRGVEFQRDSRQSGDPRKGVVGPFDDRVKRQ